MKKTLTVITFLTLCTSYTFAQFNVDLNFRARSEYRDGSRILLDDTMDPTLVSSQRTRLIFGYVDDRFEFKVAFQNARIWGVDRERANVPNINLAEGYVRYYLNEEKDKFAVVVGRQHMVLDDGRIFGLRNWNDIAVSHDLAVLEYENNGWAGKIGAGYNNDGNDYERTSYDVNNYYKYMAFLWVNRQFSENWSGSFLTSVDANEDPATFEEVYPRYTSGVYVEGGSGDFGLKASAYYQYGENPAGLDQKAYMFSVIPTYKVSSTVKLAAGYNYFSGNDQTDITDNTNRAFNKLFGDGHRYYGYLDYFLNIESNTMGTGMKELFASAFFKVSEKSELEVSYHNFSSAGTLLDPETFEGADKALGSEIDLQFKHKINDYLSARVAYATMFAQPSMEILKGGDHERYQQWAMVMLIAKPQLFSTKK